MRNRDDMQAFGRLVLETISFPTRGKFSSPLSSHPLPCLLRCVPATLSSLEAVYQLSPGGRAVDFPELPEPACPGYFWQEMTEWLREPASVVGLFRIFRTI